MEKVFGLLETAIAVMLLVAAVSMQLQDTAHPMREHSLPATVTATEDNGLRYRCNGVELAAHISMLAERGEATLLYSGTEYSATDFCRAILSVELSPEGGSFQAAGAVRENLEKRSYQIYQLDGIWRVIQ